MGDDAHDERPDRRWWLALGAIALLAAAVRTFHVLVVLRDVPPGLDAVWYSLQGGSLQSGTGYVSPPSLFSGELIPTAVFPPGYPAAQAVWQWLFGADPDVVRLLGVVLGTATVVLTGLLGRRVLDARAGLVAAAVVAVDPTLIAADGSGMSESLTVPLLTTVVLLGCRALARGLTLASGAALGLVCGAAVLTRQDLVLVVGLLLVGLALVAPDRSGASSRGPAVAATLLAGLVVVAVVAPWIVRNQRELGVATVSTISPTSALAGANCDLTYAGRSLGSWEFACVAAAQRLDLPEAEQADLLSEAGVGYARDHLDRLPLVVPARVLRVWNLWDPRDQIPREVEESRSEAWERLSWPFDVVLLGAGAWGLVTTCRGRLRLTFPLLLPPLSVISVAVISHGNPRFSAIAHPVLAVGAAAVVAGVRSRRASRVAA